MNIPRVLLFALVMLVLAVSPVMAGSYTVGLGAGMAPEYEGSDDYKALPMLMFNGKYDSGRSFSLLGTNLRVNLIASDMFQFGPLLKYRMGRDDVDNPYVDRMKDIDDATEAGVFALVDINNWLLGIDLLADISDTHDGSLVQGNLGYRMKLSGDLVLTPNAFLTYADDDYMDTYFGVNSANVGSSSLAAYKAESGIKDFGARIIANYTPWDRWGVTGILSYSRLLNDAEDSPIVKTGDDGQMFFGLMGTYRFGNK